VEIVISEFKQSEFIVATYDYVIPLNLLMPRVLKPLFLASTEKSDIVFSFL